MSNHIRAGLARWPLSFITRCVLLCLCCAVSSRSPAAPRTAPLVVYAAASLTEVLQELGTIHEQRTGQAVKFSFASSATLARQIEAGAKADIFFSADSEWMDYLQTRNLLRANSRVDLLSNRMVLIAPADSKLQLKIAPGFALAKAVGESRLSIGDPGSVPAGRYAKSALTQLRVWNTVADKLVRADSVRTALAFVERGDATLGIVYETDARSNQKVRIIDRFPADSHTPIVYPLARTASSSNSADGFIALLREPAGQAVFSKYGFGIK